MKTKNIIILLAVAGTAYYFWNKKKKEEASVEIEEDTASGINGAQYLEVRR